jgi:hypothetical protein
MSSSNSVALPTHNLQQPLLCMAFVLIYADKNGKAFLEAGRRMLTMCSTALVFS